jgi:hypothetical protein
MPQVSIQHILKPNPYFKIANYSFDNIFDLYIKNHPKHIKYIVLEPVHTNIDLSILDFDPLSYFDIKLLKKNIKIIFDCSSEGSHIFFPYFINFLKSYTSRGYDFSNFYYLTGDAVEKEIHHPFSNIYHVNIVDSYFNKIDNFDNCNKEYYFSCLTRKPRYWRSKLIYLIQTNSYIKNKSLCSHSKVSHTNPISNHTGFDVDHQILEFFANTPVMQVSSDKPLQENMPFDDIVSHLPEVYSNVLFDVCMETYQEGIHQYITEKTFKPMLNLVPTIIWGTPGINTTELTRLGFKTYEEWFDLSFDKEADTEKRLQMLFLEIIRVCNMLDNMSTTERISWQNKNTQILNYNRNLVLNLLPTNVSEINRLYEDLHAS